MADCSKCRNRYSCSEGMQEMLSANCTEFIGTSAEDRHGKDVKPEPICKCKTCRKFHASKLLVQYLGAWLSHNMMGSINASFYWTEETLKENLKIWLEQALDAYESTGGVQIKIEKQ